MLIYFAGSIRGGREDRALYLEIIKFLLEQHPDNVPIVQRWINKWFWRGTRVLALVAMMMDYMGWREASALIRSALQATIQAGTVTYDLARQMEGTTEVKCSEFAQGIVAHLS